MAAFFGVNLYNSSCFVGVFVFVCVGVGDRGFYMIAFKQKQFLTITTF